MRENYRTRKRVRKKIRWGRLFILLAFFSLIIWLGYFLCSSVYSSFNTEDDNIQVIVPAGSKPDNSLLDSRINVLVMGIDGSENDGLPHRTDSMLLISFNTADKGVCVLSIPRDTRVQIPNHDGYEKINHAYAYGGEELACQTVANFLNVPIHKYVSMDSKGFMQVVDTLGGIGVFVENDMDYDDDKQGLSIHLKKGYQKLNGENCLKYVKFRNDELGDIGRVLRQQKFVKAFTSEMFSINGLSKIFYVKSTLEDSIKTNIDFITSFKIFNSFKSYNQEDIVVDMLPGEFATIGGVSYWVSDSYKIATELEKLNIPYIK